MSAGCIKKSTQLRVESHGKITPPEITITKHHNLSFEDANRRSEELAISLKKFGLDWWWTSPCRIDFNVSEGLGEGIAGELDIENEKVIIVIHRLPSRVRVFKTYLKNKIESRLASTFSDKRL